MSWRPLVTVAGVAIPEPSTYSATTATVVDSARNAEGYMVGAVIRDDIGKISMTWNFITVENWAKIMALFSTAKGGSFTNPVTFFCQDSGTWETREMYVNDRTANVFLRRSDGSIRGYTQAALNLIEV